MLGVGEVRVEREGVNGRMSAEFRGLPDSCREMPRAKTTGLQDSTSG